MQTASAASLEKIAYSLVEDIPLRETNDRDRLGYCLWIWLTEGKGSLEQAIVNAEPRSSLSTEEIAGIIQKKLKEKNIPSPATIA